MREALEVLILIMCIALGVFLGLVAYDFVLF